MLEFTVGPMERRLGKKRRESVRIGADLAVLKGEEYRERPGARA